MVTKEDSKEGWYIQSTTRRRSTGSKLRIFSRWDILVVDSNNCQSNSSATMLEPGDSEEEIFGQPGKFNVMFFRIRGIRASISVAVYRRTRGARAILNKPVPEL